MKTDRMVVELTSITLQNKDKSSDLVKDTVYPALLDSGDENLNAPDFVIGPILETLGAVYDA